MKGLCAKRSVVVIIVGKKGIYTNTNWCAKPQSTCPRVEKGMKSGEGYELCKDVCQQPAHAEIMALLNAGTDAKDAVMYLLGHDHCCDSCLTQIKKYGIKEVKGLDDYPYVWSRLYKREYVS